MELCARTPRAEHNTPHTTRNFDFTDEGNIIISSDYKPQPAGLPGTLVHPNPALGLNTAEAEKFPGGRDLWLSQAVHWPRRRMPITNPGSTTDDSCLGFLQFMTDPRFTKLANLLITYSTRVKKGDHVLIDVTDIPDEMSVELLRAVRAAAPLIDVRHSRVTREILRGTDDKHAALVRELELARMKKMQCYIAIRGADNMSENSDVPSDRMSLLSKIIRPVLDHRVNKTRWVVLRWPTPSMAQGAGMSTEAFENLYFDVCTMDYRKMAKAMIPLQKRMMKADRVHIISPGTDLKFSVRISAQDVRRVVEHS